MMLYATSTVAMSIYNFVAGSRTPIEPSQDLYEAIKHIQHPGLDEATFREAYKTMIERRLLRVLAGCLVVADPRRRLVIGRDREDAKVDEKTGRISGGWNGWLAHDPVRGPIPFKEAVKR